MLRARDVMTTQVVAVDTGSTVSEVADLLAMHGISAVPVVDGKKVVGIVSEGDLVRRAEIGTTARPRSWWLNLFRDNAALAAEYTREHSTRVVDVMTTEVETVAETTPLSEIAELLQKKRIKRVPVVRSGHSWASSAGPIWSVRSPSRRISAGAPRSPATAPSAIRSEILSIMRFGRVRGRSTSP